MVIINDFGVPIGNRLEIVLFFGNKHHQNCANEQLQLGRNWCGTRSVSNPAGSLSHYLRRVLAPSQVVFTPEFWTVNSMYISLLSSCPRDSHHPKILKSFVNLAKTNSIKVRGLDFCFVADFSQKSTLVTSGGVDLEGGKKTAFDSTWKGCFQFLLLRFALEIESNPILSYPIQSILYLCTILCVNKLRKELAALFKCWSFTLRGTSPYPTKRERKIIDSKMPFLEGICDRSQEVMIN